MIKFNPNVEYPYLEFQIFERLKSEISWTQQSYGDILQPRLTAWYGDKVYSYSGIENKPHPWTDLLSELKEIAEEEAEATFNSVLLNYYRDGSDYISFHRDDEEELGEEPTIASMSFGDTRKFILRNEYEKLEYDLNSGSVLVMSGRCQQTYEHGIPRTSIPGERINLTFRKIL